MGRRKVSEVKVVDVADIQDSKSYQLPVTSEAFDLIVSVKAVKGLSVKDQEDELQERSDFVRDCMRAISVNFLKIGQMLSSIKADFDFAKSDYISFYNYCSIMFDLGKTTVNNLINVYNVFSSRVLNDSKYRRYTYTQLVELLPLAGTEHEDRINPSMAISQIRAYKKELKLNQIGNEKVVHLNEQKFSDNVITFDSVEKVKSFLKGYKSWEFVCAVSEIGTSFYRCYLFNGKDKMSLFAEHWQITDGSFSFVFHSFVEGERSAKRNFACDVIANRIFKSGYAASLVPFNTELKVGYRITQSLIKKEGA